MGFGDWAMNLNITGPYIVKAKSLCYLCQERSEYVPVGFGHFTNKVRVNEIL